MTTYRLVPVPNTDTFADIRAHLSDVVPCYKSDEGGCRLSDDYDCNEGCQILKAYQAGYRNALASAPVPSKQSELLEAAKEVAIAMSVYVPSAVAVQHSSVEWKRTYEAYHRLRTAIRNAEQGGGK